MRDERGLPEQPSVKRSESQIQNKSNHNICKPPYTAFAGNPYAVSGYRKKRTSTPVDE